MVEKDATPLINPGGYIRGPGRPPYLRIAPVSAANGGNKKRPLGRFFSLEEMVEKDVANLRDT